MDKPQQTDSAKLYFNIREKSFLVVAQTRQDSGMREEIGEPIRITDVAFDSRISDVLLDFLDSSRRTAHLSGKTRRYSDAEYSLFRKSHLAVSIERRPSGDLIIIPLHHSKGGFSGGYEEQIIVSKDDVPAKIPSALREAFILAT